MSTRTLPDVETLREILKPYIERATLIDELNAKVDVVMSIHHHRDRGHLCVHCGELWEEHGQHTDACRYPHTTKFEALRCQFEIPLNSADGTVVEVCGKRTVPGEAFCQGHFYGE